MADTKIWLSHNEIEVVKNVQQTQIVNIAGLKHNIEVHRAELAKCKERQVDLESMISSEEKDIAGFELLAGRPVEPELEPVEGVV